MDTYSQEVSEGEDAHQQERHGLQKINFTWWNQPYVTARRMLHFHTCCDRTRSLSLDPSERRATIPHPTTHAFYPPA